MEYLGFISIEVTLSYRSYFLYANKLFKMFSFGAVNLDFITTVKFWSCVSCFYHYSELPLIKSHQNQKNTKVVLIASGSLKGNPFRLN